MSKLQDEVLESFLARIAESGEVDAYVVVRLREALSGASLPRAEALLQLISQPEQTSA
jgi:hypothetical protein